MPIKTRAPKDLGIDDFISFIRLLLKWLVREVGDPDYRATLVDGLQAKFDALKAKFLEYKQLKIHVPEKNELYTDAADALHKGLSMLKGLLPSFFDDPDILGFFGLANPIKTDLDELYSTGQVCFDQWATVSADPEYADVAADFDNVLVLFNDFVTKRDEYELKFQAMQAAQNDMETLRAGIEEQERDLFNYYRSKHPKGDDPWWTDTPWGGTGESGEPPVTEFVATVTKVDVGEYDFWCSKPEGVVDARIELQMLPDGPIKILAEHMTIEEGVFLPLRESGIGPGEYKAFFTAYDEDNAQWGDVVVVAFTVE